MLVIIELQRRMQHAVYRGEELLFFRSVRFGSKDAVLPAARKHSLEK